MRILVIGGNGFIGSPLVRELTRTGHKVAVFHRGGEASSLGSDVGGIQGDRNRLSDYRPQVQQFSPDAIIDLILSSGEQARHLVEFVNGVTERIIAVSSMDVYRAWGILKGIEQGGLEPLPLSETSELRWVRRLYSPEAVTMLQGIFSWVTADYDKIAVEEAIASTSTVRTTILRLPMVYGPGDSLHRFFPVLKRIADGRSSIILSADYAAWRVPRGYVDNVAHAIALAATSDVAAGRVYNVCEEPCYSEFDWQTFIAKQAGWTGNIVTLPRERTPSHLLFAGNTEQHVVVSSERIRAELKYNEMLPLDEAVRRTIAWERENPPESFDPGQFDYDAEDAALEKPA